MKHLKFEVLNTLEDSLKRKKNTLEEQMKGWSYFKTIYTMQEKTQSFIWDQMYQQEEFNLLILESTINY